MRYYYKSSHLINLKILEQRIPTITKVDDLEKLPMVQAGKDLWQNKWHRHDVYGHTVEVVRILKEELNASPGLIAAGWLHDIGKPKTKLAKMENGVPILHPTKKKPYHSFPEHEKRGEEMIKFELSEDKFRILGLDRDLVARIVGYHFKPMERIKKAKMNPTFEYFCEQVLALDSHLTLKQQGWKMRF